MITTTSIGPGTWCIRRLAVRNPRSAPRSAAMAASASQSTTVELARITAASPTGIKAGTDGGLSLPEIGTGPENIQAELNRASSEQATTASGQDQRITKNDSDKGAAIIPIDAQPLGTKRLRKSRRAVRQRGLPTLLHWPDPQRAAGAAAPLRRVSSRWSATQRNLRPGWFKNRASQFGRCRACMTLLKGTSSTIRFITAVLWPIRP